MEEAKRGDTVKIHYTGKLEDGSVFDTSRERGPLEFTLGQGQVIPGFEAAVEGMKEGESKEARIEPEDGYGPRRDEMVLQVERDRLPADLDPQIGQQLQLGQPGGDVVNVRVTGVTDSNVTLDANHPLAGQPLNFDIELVKIV